MSAPAWIAASRRVTSPMGVAPSASAMSRNRPRADREALAVVRAQTMERHRRMRRLRLEHAHGRVVAAAVVHDQDLVGLAPPVAVGHDFGEVGRQAQRLIVGGNDHGPARIGHGRHGAQDQIGELECGRRRATPVLWAARATSLATAGATFLLKTLGMMYSGPSSCFATQEAMACAAASFISSLTSRARMSRSPRKKPGKQSTLLIWFG